jgi:homocysteine S-methyltransferase
LRDKLKAGGFVISVELAPPLGFDPSAVVNAGRMMKAAGAECVNVPDTPVGETRMSSIALARLLKTAAGIETIVHFSARDRNRTALQADLIGAHALGLRNIVCLKGDARAAASSARPVRELNATDLIRLAGGFNSGFDADGAELPDSSDFLIGAAIDPGAADLEAEVRVARRKVAAGASFFVSQAVFEAGQIERLLEKLGPAPPPILAGVWPLHNPRQALFVHRNIAAVPAWVFDALDKAGARSGQAGLELAGALIEELRPLAQGVYLIPSLRKFERIARLVASVKARTQMQKERPSVQ